MMARRHRLARQHTQTEARAAIRCAPGHREDANVATMRVRLP